MLVLEVLLEVIVGRHVLGVALPLIDTMTQVVTAYSRVEEFLLLHANSSALLLQHQPYQQKHLVQILLVTVALMLADTPVFLANQFMEILQIMPVDQHTVALYAVIVDLPQRPQQHLQADV